MENEFQQKLTDEKLQNFSGTYRKKKNYLSKKKHFVQLLQVLIMHCIGYAAQFYHVSPVPCKQ